MGLKSRTGAATSPSIPPNEGIQPRTGGCRGAARYRSGNSGGLQRESAAIILQFRSGQGRSGFPCGCKHVVSRKYFWRQETECGVLCYRVFAARENACRRSQKVDQSFNGEVYRQIVEKGLL